MTFDDYQHAARKTAIYPNSAMIIYPALGLAEEAGEAAGKIKRMLRDGLDPREPAKKEIGDVLWYCAALASDLGLSLEEIAAENVRKLSGRKERGTLQGSGDER